MIQLAFGTHGKTVFVSWLPHYHDMGLVGMILHPLYAGCQLVLMSPMAFLQKPIRWLQALSTYRGTVSGAPNFAYELCLNRIPADEIKKLNLTPWTLAFNGAEKVSAETIQRFSKAFSEAGFLEKSFFPTYGLAEATLFVSGPGVGMGPSYFMFENRQIVSVGQPWLNEEIVIVEPEFSRLQQHDEVGEIWVKGPAVPIGYWNQPLETLSTFRAYLAPDSIRAGAGPFLRTGDLGFLHNGQLYVTGRIKDVIIIHGRNIYPDDIERRALCVDAALKIASGAAFSVDFEGDEKIVLLQEVEREALKRLHPEEIVKKIKLEIIQNFEVRLYAVVLMMPYRLPKTTSGKVRRQAAKALFLANKVIEGEIYRSQMQGECPPC